MIWTEDENAIREVENMMNHTDETCKSCQWCNHYPGERFFTCGHHICNFTHDSWCCYWTSKNDPKVIEYNEKRKEQLKEKICKERKNGSTKD